MIKIKKKKIDLGLYKLKVSKPEIQPGESESDWMSRCIPIVVNEGKSQDAAVAQCSSVFQNKVDKRLDIKRNPSMWDISNAIDSVIRTDNKNISKWVSEVYPVKYPSGNVIIQVSEKGKGEKFFQHSYIYKDGNATISSDKFEVESTYAIKKFNETNTKFEYSIYKAPDDDEIDGIEIKKGDELQFVLGVVLEPEEIDATITDKSVGDIYSEDEVRKAAHHFMIESRGNGNDFMHSMKDSNKLKIVESFVAPVDMNINSQPVKKGTWLMGSLIFDKKIWDAIKKGEITGYSIGGISRAKFEEIEV